MSDRGSRAVVLALAVLGALTVLAVPLERCRYGLDLTDESFYLAWMRAPSTWRASVLLFGFLYHPLYALCHGDVVLLRQINLLMTMGTAAAAAFVLIHVREEGTERPRLAASLGLGIVLGASALLLFQMWLPAPSYNGLALHALAAGAAGMVLAVRRSTGLAAWVLLGVAGALAFMAKPTTAAALAVVVLATLVLGRRAPPRRVALAAAIATTLIVVAALAIDGGLIRHAERLGRGAALLRLLNAGHSVENLLRLDALALGFGDVLILGGATALVTLATALVAGASPARQRAGLALAAALALTAPAMMLCAWSPWRAPRASLGLQILAAPAGLLLGLRLAHRGVPGPLARRPALALAAGLALLPFVHAFGTSGSFWAAAARAGVFWVLAAVALALADLAPVAWPALLPGAAHALAVTAALLTLAVESPTRQPRALRADDWPDDVSGAGRPVLLATETGLYLQQLRQAATAGGFAAGHPMIDLTGHAPGALYVLRARTLGQPWIIGGYEGSAAFARAALALEPCADLARAWVLVEEGGPRRIPIDVLAPSGIDGRRDLESVGPVWAPAGEFARPYVQRLLRPLRDPATAESACRSARAAAQ